MAKWSKRHNNENDVKDVTWWKWCKKAQDVNNVKHAASLKCRQDITQWKLCNNTWQKC